MINSVKDTVVAWVVAACYFGFFVSYLSLGFAAVSLAILTTIFVFVVLGVYTGTQDGALVFIKDTICSFAAGAISGLIVFKFGTLEIASAFGAAIMMIFVYTLLYKEDKKMVLLGKANK